MQIKYMAKKPKTPKQFTAVIKKLRKEISKLKKARTSAGKKPKKPAKKKAKKKAKKRKKKRR